METQDIITKFGEFLAEIAKYIKQIFDAIKGALDGMKK